VEAREAGDLRLQEIVRRHADIAGPDEVELDVADLRPELLQPRRAS
jgi:hypothetical protein